MTRYANYDNSNGGQTAFTDGWLDGAKYQQLRGSGSRSNQGFNDIFNSAKGGADTGTIADDGGGWKLIRQDEGEKTNERKLEYKDLALQWQAAGYDVRVQDHNPDFEGGTGEIAVRISEGPKKTLDDYIDRPKDEDHLAAEDDYKDNFKNGNPWAATSAVDSYQTAFNNAAAAGKKMTANDYLMQRADDKKGGVNRFIGYLGDKNTLANEEQNYAFENFMDKAKHLDFKGPPTLNDPSEAYDKYKNDIDSIGD